MRAAGTILLAGLAGATVARADGARFDLTGPKVEVRVTRAGVTLPIASVPNLQPGDRLWLHPDLPTTQSVRYLMVLAFLRGTTNPPPDNWFYRIETWDKKVRAEGAEITVPKDAEEAVLFLAPVTGGDFTTLRSAVQGRPGVFVRASQDLAAAGFEQARIEKYIASMRELTPEQAADPKQLQERSNLIAATLALKPNSDCMKLQPDQQYTCLTLSGNQMLMDDGHGQSIVDALTGNAGAGLIGTASYTQLAGGGVYSAYVGTIVDFVHIMGSLHTAQYQYIPAIAFPQQQELNLRLNTPPSFHNPKSVIVIGLPSVQATIAPPLRASDPKQVACLAKPGVVLPVEGAPLVFSTSFAHDLVLHLNYPAGVKPGADEQDMPLTADAFHGGLIFAPATKRRALPTQPVDETSLGSSTAAGGSSVQGGTLTPEVTAIEASTGAELTGTIEGYWGFESFKGPTMPLQRTPGKDWKLVAGDPLIVGKDQHLLITSSGTACIQSIALEPASGKAKETWKLAEEPNSVDVALDLPGHGPSALHLDIHQFGDSKPASVSLMSYNAPAKLDGIDFHTGDASAKLIGTSLDEVRQVVFDGLTFKPNGASSTAEAGKSELQLALVGDAKAHTLPAGDSVTAEVALQDGRTLHLPLTVEAARPVVSLISRADVPPDSEAKTAFHIKLSSDADLPVSDALMFSMKSTQPFPREGAIEIASVDGSLHTRLGVDTSSLILEDSHTLLASLQPLKAFGSSAFGPIRLRAIAPDGTPGEWIPLVTLVRLPTLTGLSCTVGEPGAGAASASPAPEAASASCKLSGDGLYFLDSIATDAAFTNPTRVPDGFVGASLAVPPPTGAQYYLRLRDDPAQVQRVTLPAGPL